MTKSNLNIKYISIIVISLIVIIIIFILFSKKDNSNVNLEVQKEDVILYNKIISESKDISDKKNCSQIKDNGIKIACINTIEEKFDELKKATTSKECRDFAKEKNWESKEFRWDTCLYNLAIKEAKDEKDIKICEQIIDKDIKNSCLSTINLKFNNESEIKTFDDCDKLEKTKTESKELREDVCRYNKMKSIVNKSNYKDLCSKIRTSDINDVCLSEYKIKFENQKEVNIKPNFYPRPLDDSSTSSWEPLRNIMVIPPK